MHDIYTAGKGTPELTRGANELGGIIRGSDSSSVAGTRDKDHSSSRHVEAPGHAQEYLDQLYQCAIFNL